MTLKPTSTKSRGLRPQDRQNVFETSARRLYSRLTPPLAGDAEKMKAVHERV
jgi:hypothetical protein